VYWSSPRSITRRAVPDREHLGLPRQAFRRCTARHPACRSVPAVGSRRPQAPV
jgi:hypothetical protein